MIETKQTGQRVRANDDEVTELDYELAEEIARFIADRAFRFDDHECRAWALTDFEIWASLAGRDAELALVARTVGSGGEGG